MTPHVTVGDTASTTVVNLANYFADADTPYRDQLSYSVTSNTNTGLVTTGINGSVLTLTYPTQAGGSATISVQATDLNGNTVSTSFTVHLNNAPVLTPRGFFAQASSSTSQSPNLGLLVSALTAGISDADAGGLQGIAIVGTDQAHGTVQYSTDGGTTWSNVGAVSTANALLLPADASTRVRLLTTDSFSGTTYDAITFRAWDQTSGTPYNYADTSTNGGNSAFSTATDTVSMTMNSTFGAALQVSSSSPIGTAMDSQGNTVVGWIDGYDSIVAQTYLADGTPMGRPFQVTPHGTSIQNAALAMNGSGTILFVWTVQSGTNHQLYAQRFDNNTDEPIDSSPILLSTSAAAVSDLSAGMASDGQYAVAYGTADGSTSKAIVQLYDADNQLQGSPILVASEADPGSVVPDLSMAADGTFTVAWSAYDGTNYQIQALRYNADGSARDSSTTPIQIVAPRSVPTDDVSVVQQPDGGFVVAWNDQNAQAWVQHYDATLEGSTPMPLGSGATSSHAPAIAIGPDGTYEVLWTDGANAWVQFFTANSQAASGAVQIAIGVDPPSTLLRTAFLASSSSGTVEAVTGSSDTNSTTAQPVNQPTTPAGTVAAAHLFYNDSSFSGNNNSTPDNAIDTTKLPLVPDQAATFANVSSYVDGINGVDIDIAGLPANASLSTNDFSFMVGNSNNLSTWTTAPAPSSIQVVGNDGFNNTTRVRLTWPDMSITNEWLQITVKSDPNTTLTQPYVCYFGSVVGYTNANNPDGAPFQVIPLDALLLVNYLNGGGPSLVPVTNIFDINRDGTVGEADFNIIVDNVFNPPVQAIAPNLPTASIVSNETASGSGNVVFPVMLSTASTQTVIVTYTTADGTATAPANYAAKSGTLVFPAGATTEDITVAVNGVSQMSGPETFDVVLLSATNSTLGSLQSVCTVQPSSTTSASMTANEDDPDQVVSLATLFGDSQSDPNNVDTYSIVGLTNSSLLTATVLGSALQVGFAQNDWGSGSITVEQFSSSGTKTIPINVQVNPVLVLPTIGSLTTNGPNVLAGTDPTTGASIPGLGTLVLTASNISAPQGADGSAGTITGVNFYAANPAITGSGSLNTGADIFLGTGTYNSSSDTSSFTVDSSAVAHLITAGQPLTSVIYFAQASSSFGIPGPLAEATGTVQSATPVLDALPSQTVQPGAQYYFQASALAPVAGATVSYTATTSTGAVLTSLPNGVFLGTAPASGSQTVTVTATESFSTTANGNTTSHNLQNSETVAIAVAAASSSSSSTQANLQKRLYPASEAANAPSNASPSAAPNLWIGPYLTGEKDFVGDDTEPSTDPDDQALTYFDPRGTTSCSCGCPINPDTYSPSSGTLQSHNTQTGTTYTSSTRTSAIADVEVQNWTSAATTFATSIVVYKPNGVVTSNGTLVPDPAYMSSGPEYQIQNDGGTTFHLSLPVDVTGWATGRYKFVITISTYNAAIPETGYLNVVNNESGSIGNGWSIDAVDRLYFQTGSTVSSDNTGAMLVKGSNATYWFPTGGSGFGSDSQDADLNQLTMITSGADQGGYQLVNKDMQTEIFNAAGLLTKQIDQYGNTTHYQYNSSNAVTQITDYAGRTTTYGYDSTSGLLTSITDNTGRTTTLGYIPMTADSSTSSAHTVQILSSVSSPSMTPGVLTPDATSQTTHYTYDASTLRLITQTNPDNSVVNFQYDAAGFLTRITKGNGTQELVLHASEEDGIPQTLLDTSSGSSVVGETFDSQNNPVWPLGSYGNPMPVLLQNGDPGRLGYSIDANGRETTFRTDAVGNIVSQTDAQGNTTSFLRNAGGQVVEMFQPGPNGSSQPTVTGYFYPIAGGGGTFLTEVDDLTGLSSTGAQRLRGWRTIGSHAQGGSR